MQGNGRGIVKFLQILKFFNYCCETSQICILNIIIIWVFCVESLFLVKKKKSSNRCNGFDEFGLRGKNLIRIWNVFLQRIVR